MGTAEPKKDMLRVEPRKFTTKEAREYQKKNPTPEGGWNWVEVKTGKKVYFTN